jgi:hypothetical protein
MTAKVEVKADIWYDPCHVVSYTDEGDEVEDGRWCLSIETPDGEMNWSARTTETLVAVAERWGAGRGVHVMVKFLHPVGG